MLEVVNDHSEEMAKEMVVWVLTSRDVEQAAEVLVAAVGRTKDKMIWGAATVAEVG
jgi:hypothetical protein